MSKRIAKALVECGYAKAHQGELGHYFLDTGDYQFEILIREKCDPFADTLEGRRQEEALEDWLHKYHGNLLKRAKHSVGVKFPYNGRQKRLDRIEWCFEQLEVQSDE